MHKLERVEGEDPVARFRENDRRTPERTRIGLDSNLELLKSNHKRNRYEESVCDDIAVQSVLYGEC